MKNKSYPLIDLFKLVFACMVVVLHAELLNPKVELEYRIQITIFALIVPFFFVCSGFFLGGKNSKLDNSEIINKTIIKALKKYLKLYLLWGGWYFCLNLIKMVLIDKQLIKKLPFYIHQLLVEGSGGGTWYLYTLIWCVGILLLLHMIKDSKALWALSAILILLYVLGPLLFSEYFKTCKVCTLYKSIFISDKNIFFFGMYFFCGYLLGYYDILKFMQSIKKRIIIYIVIFYEIAYFLYGLLLYDYHSYIHLLVFPVLKAVAVFLLFILGLYNGSDKYNNYLIRKLSTVVYFTHWTFVLAIMYINSYLSLNSVLVSLICLISDLIISYFIVTMFKGKVYKLLFM
ncbi:acyltransferase family protein [Ruminococcus sp.]|uniref:acyltransferase family protein n=1 Tax=Ruminococcus sp. TaxID=41978 RepID=UPI0025E4EC13|nr:acyltransferase family protein [Ruminococcus sp.]